jgi:hypothetical protein
MFLECSRTARSLRKFLKISEMLGIVGPGRASRFFLQKVGGLETLVCT